MKITNKQMESLRETGDKHQLRFIILHGSQAKGTASHDSDIDIAVVGKQCIKFDKLRLLYTDLSDVFQNSIDSDIDIKTLQHIDPFFRYQVTRDGFLLYGKPAEYEEFKLYSFRDFMDSRDLRILEEKMTRYKQQLLTQRYANLND